MNAGYCRGHFGHSLGAGPGSEERHFISANAETLIELGRALAFECPLYVTGVCGLIVENQIEITSDGPVPLNRLARHLVRCRDAAPPHSAWGSIGPRGANAKQSRLSVGRVPPAAVLPTGLTVRARTGREAGLPACSP